MVDSAAAEATEWRDEELRNQGFLPSNVVGDMAHCCRALASITARCDAHECSWSRFV